MPDFIRLVAALIRKEMLAILKDPANRAILVMPIIVQSIIFGYTATFDLNHVPYALLDQSRSPTSQALVARLEGSGVFDRVATLDEPGRIRDVVENGKALLVLSIAPDFERRLLEGRPATVQAILDARNATTAGSAAAYVQQIVDRFNADHGWRAQAIEVDPRAWFNRNLESRWNLMPGMVAALSLIQTLLLTALSVAREREQGTFDQLLVTPLTPAQLMIGKAIPPVTIGLVQSTLVLVISRLWFDIPIQGSLAMLYLGLAVFLTAAVGIGLSISAVALTMQQAMMYAFVVIMPMMLLSGLITPVQTMPHWLQVGTYANPLRFGLDIVRRVYLEGVAFPAIGHDFVPLLLIAALTLPTAAWLFRHRLA